MGIRDIEMPNLENATPAFLIDEIGRLRAEQARAKKLEGVYKQALEARWTDEQSKGEEFIEGTNFIGDRVYISKRTLSVEKVQEELKDEPDRLARCYIDGGYWQLNAKVKVKEV